MLCQPQYKSFPSEVVLFVPIVLFYHWKIAGRMQEAGRIDNQAKRNLWRITSDTFRGFADVVVNRFLPYLEDSFNRSVADVSRSKIGVERLRSLSSKAIEVAIMIMIAGFVVGFYFIGGGDSRFLPQIGIFAVASLKFLPSVRSIISLIGTMRNNRHTVTILVSKKTEYKTRRYKALNLYSNGKEKTKISQLQDKCCNGVATR